MEDIILLTGISLFIDSSNLQGDGGHAAAVLATAVLAQPPAPSLRPGPLLQRPRLERAEDADQDLVGAGLHLVLGEQGEAAAVGSVRGGQRGGETWAHIVIHSFIATAANEPSGKFSQSKRRLLLGLKLKVVSRCVIGMQTQLS